MDAARRRSRLVIAAASLRDAAGRLDNAVRALQEAEVPFYDGPRQLYELAAKLRAEARSLEGSTRP